MASLPDTISRHLGRHRFAVLGYSAEDDVYCPECLRLAAGLSPHRPDNRGKPVLPLFLADPSVREEVCCHCERQLVDALPGIQPPTLYRLVRLRRLAGTTVVQHEPVGTLAIDSLGRGTLYLNAEDQPLHVRAEGPESVRPGGRVPVTARPPIVRRRSIVTR